MEFKVYRGRKAVISLIEKFTKLQKTRDVVYGLGYEDKIDRALGNGWWKKLKFRSKGKWKAVYALHKNARKPSSARAQVKYLPAGNGSMEVAIWKDTVRIFSFAGKPEAILIRDKEIAKGFKNYWEFLWKQGKPVKK